MGLVKKLLIKSGYRMTIINAPDGFVLPMEELPEHVEIVNHLEGKLDGILLFVHNQEELNDFGLKVLPHLKDDALFWVAYPKKSSKIKTDINRDQGWDVLNEKGFVGVSLISIDETWSAFRIRHTQYIKKK